MKLSQAKTYIEKLIQEQQVPQMGPSYTAVVDSTGGKVNIKCPPGMIVQTVGSTTFPQPGQVINHPWNANMPLNVICIGKK